MERDKLIDIFAGKPGMPLVAPTRREEREFISPLPKETPAERPTTPAPQLEPATAPDKELVPA